MADTPTKSISQLFELVDDKDRLKAAFERGPDACLDDAQIAMNQGHFVLAYDFLSAGLDRFPQSARIRHLASLALAQSGSLEQAWAVLTPALESIPEEHALAVEVLSLAGRISKDRWRFSTNHQATVEAGRQSVQYYLAAFSRTKDYFPGINAATMSRLTGDIDRAAEIASEVRDICRRQPNPDHWCLATLAEASLLLGDVSEAEKYYRLAASAASGRYSDVASMKRQLRLICSSLELPESILDCIPIPKVAVLIDLFAESAPRVTSAGPDDAARALVSDAINDLEIGFSYGSAGCGLDLVFATALQQAGKESTIVLPFDENEFRRTRIEPAGDSWTGRFDAVLDAATRTMIATREGYRGDNSLFAYASNLIIGLASLRAKQLETELATFAVTDSSLDPDGNRQKAFLDRHGLDDATVLDRASTAAASSSPMVTTGGVDDLGYGGAAAEHRQVMTMVFADVVGFSGFGEESTPAFVGFLDEIATIINEAEQQPVFQNTWGDGLFLVFDDVATAAQFSLKLHETIATTDWAARGLPANTNIRAGIHTGPVFPAQDKVIGRQNYFGMHVNRAARVEPVTTPGTSFATEETAAVLAAQKTPGISLDYLGERPLAKGFGSHRLYRLRRRSEVDQLI